MVPADVLRVASSKSVPGGQLNFVMFAFSDWIHIPIQAQATMLWRFLETSTKFISTPIIQIGGLLMKFILSAVVYFAINMAL